MTLPARVSASTFVLGNFDFDAIFSYARLSHIGVILFLSHPPPPPPRIPLSSHLPCLPACLSVCVSWVDGRMRDGWVKPDDMCQSHVGFHIKQKTTCYWRVPPPPAASRRVVGVVTRTLLSNAARAPGPGVRGDGSPRVHPNAQRDLPWAGSSEQSVGSSKREFIPTITLSLSLAFQDCDCQDPQNGTPVNRARLCMRRASFREAGTE
ncbi:hypothetical protein MAPG_06382 [Magnaporthiopsis poae ATCC 64411]|uniref:Uncharacterized protein n=1 Tax=Magnaporthiopsis poae (strain ATCC 64411 / 73-15) TaxID=644358 RepID=A0A0C4E1W0_MAGP6|nr:hypothetical protein MAPG_06382 [Magnaporthiopsis poae ATCC 64411]